MSSSNWTPRGRSFAPAICLFLIVFASVDRSTAFGQEKPAGSDAAQRDTTSSSAQTPSAEDRQRSENLLPRWSGDYALKAPRFYPLFGWAHSATLNLGSPTGASRFAFARSTTRPGTYQRLSAFSLSTTFIPALNPATTWNGGSGNWNDNTKWSGGVPNSTTNAFIDGGKTLIASPVTLNIGGAQVGNLTIDANDSLSFNNGTSLAVNGGTISNAGQIVINGGGGTNTILNLNSNTTLSGGGTMTLSAATGTGSAFIQQGVGGLTLTNKGIIQGTGIIGNGGLAVNNQGTIDANTATGQAGIALNGSGGVTNTSLLEATNGGTLSIQNAVNNAGGNITANGGT